MRLADGQVVARRVLAVVPRTEARNQGLEGLGLPVQDLPAVANGLGAAILSTPKVVMSDSRARTETLGGEILCTVW